MSTSRCFSLCRGGVVLLACMLAEFEHTTARFTLEIGPYNGTKDEITFNKTQIDMFQECLCSGEQGLCVAKLRDNVTVESVESSQVVAYVNYTNHYLCEYLENEQVRFLRLENNTVTDRLREYNLTASFLLAPQDCNLTTVGIWYRNANDCIIASEVDESMNVTTLMDFCQDPSMLRTLPATTTPGPTYPYDVKLGIRFENTGFIENVTLDTDGLQRFHSCLCSNMSMACLITPVDTTSGTAVVVTIPRVQPAVYTQHYMCYYTTVPGLRCNRMESNTITRSLIEFTRGQSNVHYLCVANQHCDIASPGIIWHPYFNQTLLVGDLDRNVTYSRSGCL